MYTHPPITLLLLSPEYDIILYYKICYRIWYWRSPQTDRGSSTHYYFIVVMLYITLVWCLLYCIVCKRYFYDHIWYTHRVARLVCKYKHYYFCHRKCITTAHPRLGNRHSSKVDWKIAIRCAALLRPVVLYIFPSSNILYNYYTC